MSYTIVTNALQMRYKVTVTRYTGLYKSPVTVTTFTVTDNLNF